MQHINSSALRESDEHTSLFRAVNATRDSILPLVRQAVSGYLAHNDTIKGVCRQCGTDICVVFAKEPGVFLREEMDAISAFMRSALLKSLNTEQVRRIRGTHRNAAQADVHEYSWRIEIY